jgi:hypothetical protein
MRNGDSWRDVPRVSRSDSLIAEVPDIARNQEAEREVINQWTIWFRAGSFELTIHVHFIALIEPPPSLPSEIIGVARPDCANHHGGLSWIARPGFRRSRSEAEAYLPQRFRLLSQNDASSRADHGLEPTPPQPGSVLHLDRGAMEYRVHLRDISPDGFQVCSGA